MGWTKRQLVNQAFDMIGLSSYEFDIQPNQLQAGLRQLDAMIATWYAMNIQIGYPLPTSPDDSDLDTDTQVPDAAIEAIYANLALRLAPTYGKMVTKEVKQAAKLGYQSLLRKAATPREMQFPDNFPRGSGNKSYRENDEFYNAPYGPYQPWD